MTRKKRVTKRKQHKDDILIWAEFNPKDMSIDSSKVIRIAHITQLTFLRLGGNQENVTLHFPRPTMSLLPTPVKFSMQPDVGYKLSPKESRACFLLCHSLETAHGEEPLDYIVVSPHGAMTMVPAS